MARKLSKGELGCLLKWWMALLRMRDWEITLKSQYVEGYPVVRGKCEPYVESREADITVDPRTPDRELILVHELLHALHDPIIKTNVESIPEENAVWALAHALVSLKRKAYGEEEGTCEVETRRAKGREAAGKQAQIGCEEKAGRS